MAAIEAGKAAPSFSLPLVSGGAFSLSDALKQGPVVLAFFKISCPVCQFALPYLERTHKAVKGKKVSIIGVSQNSKEDSTAFARQYGLTFPIVLDDPRKYPASNAYGITNVPTVFYIAPDHEIEISSVGWSKADIEQIARKIGEETRTARVEVIHTGEDVPAFKAG
ncbi:MAG TPA: TlpA disulfide reductase family protein [Terriglobales bacterium]|nr:TlpA disulfide reductase family protein [Terriglobales bacterium]